jgi:glycogen(starch) synthase
MQGARLNVRILFWAERIFPEIGGIETFTRLLMQGMQNRGHEVEIIGSSLSTPSTTQDAEYGFTIRRFPFAHAFKNHNLHQIKSILKQVIQAIDSFHPDLIHLNTFLTSSFYFLRIPRHKRPKTLLTLHTEIAQTETARHLQSQIIKNVDFVVGVSETTMSSYLELFPELRKRSEVIYNSVDAPQVKPKDIIFSPPTILALGRLRPIKGFDIAIKTFPSVLSKFPTGELIIAGEGEERENLEVLVHRLNLDSSVTFKGYVPNNQIADLYNQATIVIVPSRYEQFGLVAVEAGQMERPVVASRVGGLQEIIDHNKTGLLVPPNDSDSLAKSILSLLEHPDTARQYGRNARKRVNRMFSFQQFLDSYEKAYWDVIKVNQNSNKML